MKQTQTAIGVEVAVGEEFLKPARILKAKATFDKAGLSPSTGYAKIAKGEFPQPIRLSENRIGFLESEIDAWILAKAAERDSKFVPIVTNVTKVRQAEREAARSLQDGPPPRLKCSQPTAARASLAKSARSDRLLR